MASAIHLSQIVSVIALPLRSLEYGVGAHQPYDVEIGVPAFMHLQLNQ
jgi:hypothetical protein